MQMENRMIVDRGSLIGGDLLNRHLITEMGSPNPITCAEAAEFGDQE